MDSRNRRDGSAIEELGWFNPIEADKPFELKEDRILEWLQKGAQPSDALHGLMKHSGLAHRWHLVQQGLDEKTIEKEMKKWAMTREESLKNSASKAEDKAKKAKEAKKTKKTDKANKTHKTNKTKKTKKIIRATDFGSGSQILGG